jgi:hypothetical protein
MNNLTTIQKTRILPLRWIGNISGEFASNHLLKAVYMDEDGDFNWRYSYHAKMWKILDKPYQWWGTYYELDIKGMMDDLKLDGAGWDDYDKDGIPYWEKWEDEGGPVKDTEERLKYMEENGI